jgi:hypothetical protein
LSRFEAVNISISLVNLFLSPVAVAIARQRARARKHKDFFHHGIAVYCSEEQVQTLKRAVDELVCFYADEWVRYQKNLKRIILDDELQTLLWVARRTTIIQESDTSRMSSVEHLASWLVADCERVQVHRENGCTHIVWKKGITAIARKRADEKRAEYLSRG